MGPLSMNAQIHISEEGNVGINNMEPKHQLDVSGDINASGKIKEKGGDLLPSGSIIMWTKPSIPTGWLLCDGNENTPDLVDKFIVAINRNGKLGNEMQSNIAVTNKNYITDSVSTYRLYFIMKK